MGLTEQNYKCLLSGEREREREGGGGGGGAG